MNPLNCRFCQAPLEQVFADLGMSPFSNAYLSKADLLRMEPFYPLKAFVCARCFLVQLPAFESPEHIFREYAYFSSVSESWVGHVREYVERMMAQYRYGNNHLVIEVASNDGYLLQFFKQKGVPVLGIEPAANVARVAEEVGIPTLVRFFGAKLADELAAEGRQADLLIGNNVLAHVPDLNDFVDGLRRALKPDGLITMEFPHLQRLMEQRQFDTIYHEHFSYFSFTTVRHVFDVHGLTVCDVEEIPTHGGSLRIYARHAGRATLPVAPSVDALLRREADAGFGRLDHYLGFDQQIAAVKRDLLEFLIGARRAGRRIVGYGAAAKGNTLLNYCGIRGDLLEYVVDRSPHKQGRFLPGTHLPIYPADRVRETKPDYLLILPWNLRDEVMRQMAHIREWGGQFVVPIPAVEVFR